MRYKNEFTIHTTKQLIDINKGILNFKANISITSENENENYDIVIVTQEELDNIDFEFNYKKIDHYINVELESNYNKKNDYVLVIKSENKINVEIDIDLVDLDEQPPTPQPPQLQHPQLQPEQQLNPHPPHPHPPHPVQQQYMNHEGSGNKPNYLMYIGILILAGLLIYYLFFYSSKKNGNTSASASDTSASTELKTIDDIDIKSQVQEVVPKSVVKEEDFNISMEEQKGASLLDQLRELRN